MYLCYNTLNWVVGGEFMAQTWGSMFGTPSLCESCTGSSIAKQIAGIHNNPQVTTDIGKKFGCHWETTSHYM
jgi:hypothetical protein